MLEDKSGNLWFGTNNGGVTKYDGKTFTHFTVKEGLSNNNVRSILEDASGHLWFGTGGGGVNKFDGKTFTHYTVKEGLSDDFVESLMEDRSGNIWVGTSNGLNKMSKGDVVTSNAASNRYFRTYTYEDGFTGIGVNIGKSMYEDKNGTIWVGADDRLTAFYPEMEAKDTVPPTCSLRDFRFSMKTLPGKIYLLRKIAVEIRRTVGLCCIMV